MIFQDIIFEWRGSDYKIPADGVMRAIAVVEDVITVGELLQIAAGQRTFPYSRIAMAFGRLLRHAGGKVSDAEIYEAMFEGKAEQQAISVAVNQLLMVAMPASTRKRVDAELEQQRSAAVEPVDAEAAARAAAELAQNEALAGNSKATAPAL